ncbi:MAG: hypothetical protein KGL53_06560 [Elusimicrobia bacterium]|nr:hypothetical protein [Elusimicrobiota bacterium]
MRTTITAAAVLLLAGAAQASPGRALGAWASKAARRAHVERVAVLPFQSLDGSSPAEGRRLAEQAATELARRGKVEVVERSLLAGLLSEQRLGLTGAVDPRSAARVGELAEAQAVVMGTFVTAGDEVEVDARLVLVQSGVAVAAEQVSGRRSWYPADVIPDPQPITPDMAVADAYEYQTGRRYRPRGSAAEPAPVPAPLVAAAAPASDLRDAPADPCAGAAARVNALQAGILELKARYWAAQAMRPGFSFKKLRSKPADTIPDPALRRRFLALMTECRRGDPPLTFSEVRRFVAADQRSFALLAACRPAAE